MPKLSNFLTRIFLKFQFLSKSKKAVFLLSFFVVIGIITPLYQAKAIEPITIAVGVAIVAAIGSLVYHFESTILEKTFAESLLGTVIQAAVTTVLQIPLFIGSVFLSASTTLLGLATSPNFIKYSYTGQDNPLIKYGWTITRDLSNMIIVIVLLVIGLATILRIENYQAKKTLPILIGVALLINFTPVILGAIIDASNILMNYFLGPGNPDQKYRDFTGFYGVFSQGLKNTATAWGMMLGTGSTTPNLMPLANTIVLVFYSFIGGFVFLCFFLLFVFRYVALWIAVILSPLAFVAYILPSTKKYASQWWNFFIQWCFIGVTAAFFLYLALTMLAYSKDLMGVKITTPEGEAWQQYWQDMPNNVPQKQLYNILNTNSLIDELLPYFVIIVFLIMSLFATFSISAKGASTILNSAKKGGKVGGLWTARQTLGRLMASKTGQKMAETKIPTLRQAFSQPAGKLGTVGKVLKIAGAGLATATGARWALRGFSKAGLQYGASQEKNIEAEKKKIESEFGKDYQRAAASYDTILPGDWIRKIAMGRYLAETKGGKGLSKLSDKEFKEIATLTARYNPRKIIDLVKHKPEAMKEDKRILNAVKNIEIGETLDKQLEDKDVKELIKIGVEPAEAIKQAAFKKAVDELKKEDFDNLSPEALDVPEVQEMIIRYKPWDFIRKIAEEKGTDYLSKLQELIEKKGVDDIAKTNPSFIKAPYTTFGSQFLEKFAGIADMKEAEERIKAVKKKHKQAEINMEETIKKFKESQGQKPTTKIPPGKTGWEPLQKAEGGEEKQDEEQPQV